MTQGLIEDAALQVRLRRMLANIRPMKAIGVGKKRYGRDWDGGYVLLETVETAKTVYSLGIAGDVSWDAAMAELGADVFMYDHTIERLPLDSPRFHFERLGIGAEDDPARDLRRLDTLMRDNGHDSSHRMVLKIDIELEEWACLDGLDGRDLCRFDQIVGEFHHTPDFMSDDWIVRGIASAPGSSYLLDDAWLSRAERVFAKLCATHQVVHVHGNNNRPFIVVAGIPLPEVFELTFANRAAYAFEATDEVFPTALDRPNTPLVLDLMLGRFAF